MLDYTQHFMNLIEELNISKMIEFFIDFFSYVGISKINI